MNLENLCKVSDSKVADSFDGLKGAILGAIKNRDLYELAEQEFMNSYEPEDAQEFMDHMADIIYQQDIIYYDRAIKYLAENDPSLQDSFAEAAEAGYRLQNLNSEVLATILYQSNLLEALNGAESEIEDAFDNFGGSGDGNFDEDLDEGIEEGAEEGI